MLEEELVGSLDFGCLLFRLCLEEAEPRHPRQLVHGDVGYAVESLPGPALLVHSFVERAARHLVEAVCIHQAKDAVVHRAFGTSRDETHDAIMNDGRIA